MVLPIYARKAAAAARTAPKEMTLAAAAPVDSGTPAEEVPLAPPDEAVEAGLEAVPEAEPVEGLAELATGTVVLPAGTAEVTRVGTTTGTELATAGTELAAEAAELMTEATEEATSMSLVKDPWTSENVVDLPAGTETAGTDVAAAGVETAGTEAVAVAGGAWIVPSLI